MPNLRRLDQVEIGTPCYRPGLDTRDEWIRVLIPELPPASYSLMNTRTGHVTTFSSGNVMVEPKTGPAYIQITEVWIKKVEPDNQRDGHLKGFVSITLNNSIVIKDFKIIQGHKGLFVSMPSRRIHDHCTACGGKNDVDAVHCRGCGVRLPADRIDRDPNTGRHSKHRDVAHPITLEMRQMIQDQVLEAYYADERDPG